VTLGDPVASGIVSAARHRGDRIKLASGPYPTQVRPVIEVVDRKGVVAGNAEHVGHPELAQTGQHILNGGLRHLDPPDVIGAYLTF
jgi:hypothetical protein